MIAFTDGEENSSRELTRSQLFTLIKDREAAGWTFVYMGANQDAYAEAGGMGLDAGKAANWQADVQGTRAAFGIMSAATRRKRDRGRRGEAEPDDFFGS